MARRQISRERDGSYRLRLSRDERELLESLPAQLDELLDEPSNPDLRRLFPAAYEDGDAQDEFARLVGDELMSGRRRALATIASTAGGDRLTARAGRGVADGAERAPARARHPHRRERGRAAAHRPARPAGPGDGDLPLPLVAPGAARGGDGLGALARCERCGGFVEHAACAGRRRPRSWPATSAPCCGTASSGCRG